MSIVNIMKNIYLVRHGQSRSNDTGIMEDDMMTPLTSTGKKQAHILARRISKLHVDTLFSSPMERAKETAEIISRRIKIPTIINKYIYEKKKPIFFIGMNTRSKEFRNINDKFELGLLQEIRCKGGESFQDIVARADKFLVFLKKTKADNIVVVTHGVFIRVLIFRMLWGNKATLQNYFKFLHSTVTGNTGISLIVYDKLDKYLHVNNGWRLKCWNDSAHFG